MQRSISKLSRAPYDVAVIGGGVYGAFVAWDAAQRGLRVALVDQADFAGGTSSNSQKIIHGGLRYLQSADIRRMRESIRERSTLMRIAPHLVQTMPVIVPTFHSLMRGRLAMRFALTLNDLISVDRNRKLPSWAQIPGCQIISREECLHRVPGLDPEAVTGGALFFDGQVYNAERLILSVIHSAAGCGADLANYVQVVGLKQQEGRVAGLEAKDTLTGNLLELQTKMVVNCTGPWLAQTQEALTNGNGRLTKDSGLVKAFLLITRRCTPDFALGIPLNGQSCGDDASDDKGSRLLFTTPWRHATICGTFYAPHQGPPEQPTVTPEEIDQALCKINAAYPAANLTRRDVHFVCAGLLPRADSRADGIEYAEHYQIYDHEKEDGLSGLISVMGVKYTTARDVAEKAVDLVFKKLGSNGPRCRTAFTPLHGGSIEHLERFEQQAKSDYLGAVAEPTITHLVRTYGSEYRTILEYCAENPNWCEPLSPDTSVIDAEVVHGLRQEMAQKLADVVFRRTELGTAGSPGDAALERCASIMAAELQWSEQKVVQELEEVRSSFV